MPQRELAELESVEVGDIYQQSNDSDGRITLSSLIVRVTPKFYYTQHDGKYDRTYKQGRTAFGFTKVIRGAMTKEKFEENLQKWLKLNLQNWYDCARWYGYIATPLGKLYEGCIRELAKKHGIELRYYCPA